jgi:hypothetical protein
MNYFISILVTMLCSLRSVAEDNVFYLSSDGQLRVPAKALKEKNVDAGSLIRSRDLVLVTLDLDAHTLMLEYLDSTFKNLKLNLDKAIEGNPNSFGIKVLGSNTFKQFNYTSGDTKLISLECTSGDQLIFGEINEIKAENLLIPFIKKTGLVLNSTSYAKLTADDVKNIGTADSPTNKMVQAEATISFNKINKSIKFTFKSGDPTPINIHYKKISHGIRQGIEAIVFGETDDDNIAKVLFSITTNSFTIIYKDNSSLGFVNLNTL